VVFGEQKVGTHFNYSCLTAGPALLHVVSLSLNLSLALSLSFSLSHAVFETDLAAYLSQVFLCTALGQVRNISAARRRRRHRLELELVRLRHCCQRRFCCFFCQRVKVSALPLSLLLLLLLLLLLPVAVCLFAQSFISFEPPGGYSSVLCFVINTNTHTQTSAGCKRKRKRVRERRTCIAQNTNILMYKRN